MCLGLVLELCLQSFLFQIFPSLEAIKRRAWVTASTSVVKLEVETVYTVSMDGGRTLLDSEAPP